MPAPAHSAAEQGPLSVGERLCDLPFLGPDGRVLSLYQDALYGWPKAILLAGAPAAAEAALLRLAALNADFGRCETHVLAVTQAPPEQNGQAAQRLKLPFPVLSDPNGALRAAAGIAESAPPRVLFFDRVLRLERVIEMADQQALAESALEHARARAKRERVVVVTAQPPVLVVPNVLDPEHCRRLIQVWEQGRKIEGTVASERTAENVLQRQTKVRRDVEIPQGSDEEAELVGVLRRRLLPEVLKSFNFEATRTESFRIGCYDAAEGGHFAPHRDNTTTQTAFRRYALTLNLNTGAYEGGFLRLPEYGPQLYAPPAGGAVVFSCALLHTATPVAKGRRFALFGFFYGEAEEAERQRTQERLAAAR